MTPEQLDLFFSRHQMMNVKELIEKLAKECVEFSCIEFVKIKNHNFRNNITIFCSENVEEDDIPLDISPFLGKEVEGYEIQDIEQYAYFFLSNDKDTAEGLLGEDGKILIIDVQDFPYET